MSFVMLEAGVELLTNGVIAIRDSIRPQAIRREARGTRGRGVTLKVKLVNKKPVNRNTPGMYEECIIDAKTAQGHIPSVKKEQSFTIHNVLEQAASEIVGDRRRGEVHVTEHRQERIATPLCLRDYPRSKRHTVIPAKKTVDNDVPTHIRRCRRGAGDVYLVPEDPTSAT